MAATNAWINPKLVWVAGSSSLVWTGAAGVGPFWNKKKNNYIYQQVFERNHYLKLLFCMWIKTVFLSWSLDLCTV